MVAKSQLKNSLSHKLSHSKIQPTYSMYCTYVTPPCVQQQQQALATDQIPLTLKVYNNLYPPKKSFYLTSLPPM